MGLDNIGYRCAAKQLPCYISRDAARFNMPLPHIYYIIITIIFPLHSLLSSSFVCGERGATPAHTHQYMLIKKWLTNYIRYYPILITSLYNYMLLFLFRIFPHTITSFNM